MLLTAAVKVLPFYFVSYCRVRCLVGINRWSEILSASRLQLVCKTAQFQKRN
jgi:ABC-type uncharacterized transport system permease subunit